MASDISSVCSELKTSADAVKADFGGLSFERLNWRPAEKSWSVAQCLDHVIVTHSLYFPLFERLAAGDVNPTLWQRVSPLSGFFGRFLIKSLDPANMKPMKTTSKAMPSSSDIDAGIIDRYSEHQQQMIAALERLPVDIDTSMIITSPLLSIVTYTLADTLVFVPMHCKRHFLQAKRLTEAGGFPTGN